MSPSLKFHGTRRRQRAQRHQIRRESISDFFGSALQDMDVTTLPGVMVVQNWWVRCEHHVFHRFRVESRQQPTLKDLKRCCSDTCDPLPLGAFVFVECLECRERLVADKQEALSYTWAHLETPPLSSIFGTSILQ